MEMCANQKGAPKGDISDYFNMFYIAHLLSHIAHVSGMDPWRKSKKER